ncbi:PLP-dependent aspartate aminotransferase family protein [Amycolatopsis sp. FDAARGOS 1241]|uniref:trans-sulfuration enzyme family protein n=1 Tax=Amycolatopsis sp. FDAARGOS 1241 TaxID=2778070 RepID=UPI00194E18BE|nr:PLP-dependent transferase [Amycolatopsis sp. FDAARGOS 1241]QRP47487.1 PLP-dependent transferase [Amycolatopsis sp. FDAARGOS 1241]
MTDLRTRAVHAGRDDLTDLGLHAAPLDYSTTYPSRDSAAEARRIDEFAAGGHVSGIYGRIGNPTVERFERALAELEGFEHAVAFASGMSAVQRGKRHVVGVRSLYGSTDHLLTSGLLGTEVTWGAPEDAARAVREDTGRVFVETPANPALTELDIAALVERCGAVPVLVDNTFATPVLQCPGHHGARLVLHSATKFLGGHGDVMGGVVACDAEEAARLRDIRFATGAVLHPLAGYLLLRGLSTLPLRVTAASATAAVLAERLAQHPAVTAVHHPRIGGPLVAFEVAGDPHAVIGAVRVITPAVSLGSVDTLIQHPASLTHPVAAEHDREKAGITGRLIRLSAGLEDVEDLRHDLDQALKAC